MAGAMIYTESGDHLPGQSLVPCRPGHCAHVRFVGRVCQDAKALCHYRCALYAHVGYHFAYSQRASTVGLGSSKNRPLTNTLLIVFLLFLLYTGGLTVQKVFGF